MIGSLYYSLFLIMGVMYSDSIFQNKSIYFKIWAGGIIANTTLMFGIIPLAFLLGFTKTAHIILAVLFTGIYFCIRKKPSFSLSKPSSPAAVTVGGISFLICLILENHIMMPIPGGIASGQSTYGDLAMHMGFISSIAEQKVFPPSYNILSGVKLSYPFLVDSLSSSLYLFGTSLRTSILYPSFVFAFLIVSGFYYLALKLTQSKKASVLSCIMFFLGGGFGFLYFLDGAREDSFLFTRIFTEFYKTPTNFNENNLRWANPICDMIVPQRTTMAGWCILFFALWLLADLIKNRSKKSAVMLGFTAGALPMIHTHSFLALGIISAVLFFAVLKKSGNKKDYIKLWLLYGVPAILIALPQLCFWTFSQSIGNEQFVRISPLWVNTKDPNIWFWIKNWGVTAIFTVPAFFAAKNGKRKWMVAGLVIFIICEMVVFQPNEYDNNKLFFVSYMIFLIFTADYLIILYEKIKGMGGTRILAVLIIFISVFSGVLTIVREFISGGEYMTFSENDIEFAEFVKKNTAPDDIFLTGSQHLNPICVLAGRNIYAGSDSYLYYHGFADEMNRRYEETKIVYESTDKDAAASFAKNNKIRYILISNAEKSQFNINDEIFSGFDCIYNDGRNTLYDLYKLSKRD